MEKKKNYYGMSYVERIKEFIGEGGCIAFEHGFRGPVSMITDKEVTFRAFNCKLDLETLDPQLAVIVWENICEYLAYCQVWA